MYKAILFLFLYVNCVVFLCFLKEKKGIGLRVIRLIGFFAFSSLTGLCLYIERCYIST
jgi:hypothetical protein